MFDPRGTIIKTVHAFVGSDHAIVESDSQAIRLIAEDDGSSAKRMSHAGSNPGARCYPCTEIV